MADTTSDIRSTLNGLIETLKDGEEGFRNAAENLENSSLKTRFQSYANQRGRFAAELQNQVSSVGGTPETSGSTMGSIHRGWINLKAAVTGRDDHAILEEAERGEDAAVKNYRDALTKDLPADIRSIVQQQYSEVLATHNQVKALRDGTATMGTSLDQTY